MNKFFQSFHWSFITLTFHQKVWCPVCHTKQMVCYKNKVQYTCHGTIVFHDVCKISAADLYQHEQLYQHFKWKKLKGNCNNVKFIIQHTHTW